MLLSIGRFCRAGLALLISTVGASGCCLLAPREATDSGFLPLSGELREMDHHVPFDSAFIPDIARLEAAKAQLSRVCVLPVSTALVEDAARAQDLPKGWLDERIEDFRGLAANLHAKLVARYEAFEPEREIDHGVEGARRIRLSPCEGKFDSALVWELALVEVTPNIPVVSALGTLANFFFHGSALVRALGAGSVTIEGVLRDGRDMTPLLVFRERRADKIALFSVRNYTVYGHTRRVFTELSNELVTLTYTPYSYDVSGAWSFTFNPL